MKFICPESQKRVSLKCGNIASGSLAGGLPGSSAGAASAGALTRAASCAGGESCACRDGETAKMDSQAAAIHQCPLNHENPLGILSPLPDFALWRPSPPRRLT